MEKFGLAHSFTTPTSESVNFTLSWICKQPLLFRAYSFPTLTSESINLTLSWIGKQPLLSRGWGITGPAHSFPTLTSESINLVQKLCYLGGEKLGLPILSPTRLVKVSTLPFHEYANNRCFLGPILSPPWQNKAWTMCGWLFGWRKTGLVHYFPTLTSESINLTLSWIHIQSLLIRTWGKTGPAQSFPTLTSESINRALSWICKQPMLFRGWGITGQTHSFPTLTR